MAIDYGTRAVELLIAEAWNAVVNDRYAQATAAAQRAVQAAEELDDPELLVRALVVEANPLRMSGDVTAALARYTRVLAMAEDPSTSSRLGSTLGGDAVARAYTYWVECALDVPGIASRDLLGVLDTAERWLTTTGHQEWRPALLLKRARVHLRLNELAAATAAAEEAMATYRPGMPGDRAASYRIMLGEVLVDDGRHRDAEPHYRAILDDPDAGQYVRSMAYRGLAKCAAEAGDGADALRHATAAVRYAESVSDDALTFALDALLDAARALGDLDAAWHAATRRLDAAIRIGGHVLPYHATRDAVDIALDRGDLATAQRLLADLDRYADVMDRATDSTDFHEAVERRRQRLAERTGSDAVEG